MPEKIKIGDNVRIDDFCILSGRVVLGNYIHIAAYTALFGGDTGILAGDYANFSSRISVYAVSDDFTGATMTNPMIPSKYKNLTNKQVNIGKHVLFGSGCVVLPGVELKEGCCFGALSLVNRSCEEWTIYAGIPIRRIKARSRDILQLEKNFISER